MTQRYESLWWSIGVPSGWRVEPDDDCTTLISDRGVGALQLSAYQTESCFVTFNDLTGLAREEIPTNLTLSDAKWGDFDGLQTKYHEENIFWRKAWLCHDNVLLYATYNCRSEDESKETAIVENILSTLTAQ